MIKDLGCFWLYYIRNTHNSGTLATESSLVPESFSGNYAHRHFTIEPVPHPLEFSRELSPPNCMIHYITVEMTQLPALKREINKTSFISF